MNLLENITASRTAYGGHARRMLKYVVRHRSHSGRALSATHFAEGEGDSRVIRCRRITLRKFPPPYIWTLLVPESPPTLLNSGCLAEVTQHWTQLERVKLMQLTSARLNLG